MTGHGAAGASADGRHIAIHNGMATPHEALMGDGKRPTLHIVAPALPVEDA